MCTELKQKISINDISIQLVIMFLLIYIQRTFESFKKIASTITLILKECLMILSFIFQGEMRQHVSISFSCFYFVSRVASAPALNLDKCVSGIRFDYLKENGERNEQNHLQKRTGIMQNFLCYQKGYFKNANLHAVLRNVEYNGRRNRVIL